MRGAAATEELFPVVSPEGDQWGNEAGRTREGRHPSDV